VLFRSVIAGDVTVMRRSVGRSVTSSPPYSDLGNLVSTHESCAQDSGNAGVGEL